jgi:hypothetical protein
MTKLEIILLSCIVFLSALLIIVVDIEEDDISQLKYDNAELKAQLEDSGDVNTVINSLIIQP